jgi:hypothetical protein
MSNRNEIVVLVRDAAVGLGYGVAMWGALFVLSSEPVVSVGGGLGVGLLVLAVMRRKF